MVTFEKGKTSPIANIDILPICKKLLCNNLDKKIARIGDLILFNTPRTSHNTPLITNDS
jgi:hypothetical protein